MFRWTPSRPYIVASVLLIGGGVGSLAAGQPPEAPALGGPRVKDREVPGVRETFAEGEAGRFMQNQRLPLPVFTEALKRLTAEDAPAEIRATPAQEAKIRGLVQAFEQDQRKYREANRGELRRLRESAQAEGRGQQGRSPGERGGDDAMAPAPMQGGDAPAPAGRRAAAERMREIERNGPRVEDLYTKVWAELTEPQRAAVDARLDEYRKERAKNREDEYVRQRVAKNGGAGTPPPSGEPARPRAARPAADAQRAQRRDRLLRAFEQLPPEEQDRILDRLEQRMRDAGQPGPNGRRGGAGDDKPAPPVDRVRVPAPEQPSGKPD